jgi:CDP-6-deoxy-D-xylo-4-hexulose-3-dehydrase
MKNNITEGDNKAVINFLKSNPILTNNKKVLEFEKKWSKWLGVNYSVFVNSGSSANLLSISYLKTIHNKGEIIVPALTWVSDVTSILYNGFTPVFVDINLNNLGANYDSIKKSINKNTIGIFLTHALGFNALSDKLLDLIRQKKLILIEDVCEAHGASFKNKKLGNYGKISNFSFYYAHHMSTIEGGMVCTNDKKIYDIIRVMRSHGMIRESVDLSKKKSIYKKYSNLNKDFIFAYPGYNFRSTEINAVYGLNQLKKLTANNQKRVENFSYFLSKLDESKYCSRFDLIGSCNYAFVIIFEKNFRNKVFRKKFETILQNNKIEFRRGTAGGGNQTLQPYLSSFKKNYKITKNLTNTNIIHDYGYYIGNYPNLKRSKILEICQILNSI